MENKKKKVKLDPIIVRDLWSEEEKIVLKTLRKLRSVGNIGYIPELLKLLEKTANETVRKEVVLFIADVKDPGIVPFILSGLKDPGLKGARGSVVSACWQSGLDYSKDLELFVQLFYEGDYITALEAFTVIEEAAINLNHDQLNKVLEKVKEGLKTVNEEKKPLALELEKLLQE